MSRPSSAAARQLTLTEELEKLEQSITLTLQEIDSNFSRAHRIVTSSILPIVEQYAKHSEAVWEGSKFWKQFFEASANVSLSGYEEPHIDDTTTHKESTGQPESSYASPSQAEADDIIPGSEDVTCHEDLDSSLLSSPSVGAAHSTPRMPSSVRQKPPPKPTFTEDYPSPYEALKREVHGTNDAQDDSDHSPVEQPPETTVYLGSHNPVTPAKREAMPDTSMTPTSSPFAPLPSTQRPKSNDPLLHHMLDKTYRIQATPHTAGRKRIQAIEKGRTPGTAKKVSCFNLALDSSPMSSPEIAAPQLRADIFSSPFKAPRTPGVSVQTPARKKALGLDPTPRRSIGNNNNIVKPALETPGFTKGGVWDSDEDDFDIDISPPKTMQFHVPQSRLLQTPAREASRRIVEDLLMTAGGDITESEVLDDDSPSVVRRANLDETF